MTTRLSIVVPVLNAEATLEKCLASIYASEGAEGRFEVIVVDDGSTDRSVEIAQRFPCRIVSFGENRGISAARNAGARAAKFDVIYFVDADIVQKPDTIGKFLRAFDEDPGLVVAQAIWAKESLNPSFGGDFWALKTYHLVKIRQLGRVEVRRDARSFNSGCLCVKKDVFWKFGGFDEKYTKPGGEEHLLAFQMAYSYPLYQYKDIEVFHHFARAWPKVKIQLKRARRLGGIFGQQRTFGSVGSTTKDEASRCAIAANVVLFAVLGIAFHQALWVALGLFGLFVLSGAGFYVFLFKEKNAGFALAGVLYDFVLYVVTGAGIALGLAGFVADRILNRGDRR